MHCIISPALPRQESLYVLLWVIIYQVHNAHLRKHVPVQVSQRREDHPQFTHYPFPKCHTKRPSVKLRNPTNPRTSGCARHTGLLGHSGSLCAKAIR